MDMTEVIKRSRDNGEKLWNHVRELMGRTVEEEDYEI